MKTNQSSTTAENNAAIRAFESMRPANERICFDPYAEYFLPDSIRYAENTCLALKERISAWEKAFPGVCDAIVARTRFFDDCLQAAVEDDAQQLVMLGAGYDTRAFRISGLKTKMRIFEVDHPATQKEKLKRFSQNRFAVPGYVVFIPVNFEEEDFAHLLVANGYEEGMKSFFIWEGMTYYVSAETVEKTLSFISSTTCEGSTVVFDYFPSSVAAGTSHLIEARRLSAALEQIGESIMFGIDKGEVKDYVNQRGFDLTKNMSAGECRPLYFQGPNRRRAISDMFFFAQANVK